MQVTQDGWPQVPGLWLLQIRLPHFNPRDPRGTYHSGRYGHGVVQQGLGGLGAQEVQEVLEGLSLQGCLQLLSGQGALGVPVDLQLRTGMDGHMGGGIKTSGVVGSALVVHLLQGRTNTASHPLSQSGCPGLPSGGLPDLPVSSKEPWSKGPALSFRFSSV